MKKHALQNGDFIITRNGHMGVVILKDGEGYILYQTIGMDDLDCFDDNLNDLYASAYASSDLDIMEVYRGGVSFLDLENNDCYEALLWARDTEWNRLDPEVHEAKKETAFKTEQPDENSDQYDTKKDEYLNIITQFFYGNRTATSIKRENVKSFIRGYLDPSLAFDLDTVDLKYIPVPGAEHIVIVYDQYKEEQYVNVEFPEIYAERAADYFERYGEELTMRPSCTIPELNLKLYTRCFACRIDEKGELQSLEEGDEEAFIEYFAE